MKIDDACIRMACATYSFTVSDSAMVIIAIRGCFPELCSDGYAETAVTPGNYKIVIPKPVDYKTASCTIGVWLTASKEIALFPGSTVPSLHYLHAFPESVRHFNILCPGKYTFERGIHPRRIAGYERHEALLMVDQGWVVIPKVIRNAIESSFDFNRCTYNIMYARDNLHASRTESLDIFNCHYSSSGCLNIVGQPLQYVRNKAFPFSFNYWEQFMQLVNSCSAIDDHMPLLLFNYADFDCHEKNAGGLILRYGSEGVHVMELQEKLSQIYTNKNGLYYTASIDGKLLASTAEAYLQFMKDYYSRKIAGEANLQFFNTLTSHFKYKSKYQNYVIN